MMVYKVKLHVGWTKYILVIEAENEKEAFRKTAVALTSNFIKVIGPFGNDVNIKSSNVNKFTL